MLTFKECISSMPILRFLYEHLHTSSPLGKKELLQTHFITEPLALENCFNEIENVINWLANEKNNLPKVKQLLAEARDIHATIQRLKNGDALDDVELFEIKKSALVMNDLRQILQASSFSIFELYDVNEVIDILDPEKTRLPYFYIYSSYNKELTALRNMNSKNSSEDLLWQIAQLENKIRQNLLKKLTSFASYLEQNLKYIAKLDLLLAKAQLATEWNCCKPIVSEEKTSYIKLVHPVVANRLKNENADFQPIDIELKKESCLITGANMTGKSVFLRALAFSQWMFQFGFYVPAQKAEIMPVEKIHFVAGDSDTENTGLSSYVKEIFHIHQILQEMKAGRKMLVLVDEFARTTNPHEGSALVAAFLEMMNKKNAICLVTTHYSNVEGAFRRLRVKGIQWDKIEQIKTKPSDLNKFIDYQLEDDQEKAAPKEAVKIAEILKIDDAFISLVKKYL